MAKERPLRLSGIPAGQLKQVTLSHKNLYQVKMKHLLSGVRRPCVL